MAKSKKVEKVEEEVVVEPEVFVEDTKEVVEETPIVEPKEETPKPEPKKELVVETPKVVKEEVEEDYGRPHLDRETAKNVAKLSLC